MLLEACNQEPRTSRGGKIVAFAMAAVALTGMGFHAWRADQSVKQWGRYMDSLVRCAADDSVPGFKIGMQTVPSETVCRGIVGVDGNKVDVAISFECHKNPEGIYCDVNDGIYPGYADTVPARPETQQAQSSGLNRDI